MQEKKPGDAPLVPPEEVSCPSCGALFPADRPNCPCCGAMYLPAAEAAYMDKLDSVHDGLEELGVLHAREAKKNYRALWRRLLIGGILLAAAIAAGFVLHGVSTRREARHSKEELVWKEELFPRMDAAYEAEDYDELLRLYQEACAGDFAIWSYGHCDFCRLLYPIQEAQRTMRRFESDECDRAMLLHDELPLFLLDEQARELTAEERGRLAALTEPLKEDCLQRFQLTDEELAAFMERMRTETVIPYLDCENFLNERDKEK